MPWLARAAPAWPPGLGWPAAAEPAFDPLLLLPEHAASAHSCPPTPATLGHRYVLVLMVIQLGCVQQQADVCQCTRFVQRCIECCRVLKCLMMLQLSQPAVMFLDAAVVLGCLHMVTHCSASKINQHVQSCADMRHLQACTAT